MTHPCEQERHAAVAERKVLSLAYTPEIIECKRAAVCRGSGALAILPRASRCGVVSPFTFTSGDRHEDK